MEHRSATTKNSDKNSESTTIVIPQYGHCELTLRCVRQIRETDPVCWPIVIADDGSSCDQFAWLHEHLTQAGLKKNVQVLSNSHRGLSATWNSAAEQVKSQFIVFLNNDVSVSGPFIGPLIEPLSADQALMTGVRWRWERALPVEILQRLPTARFLEGWCFAVGKTSFENLNGFDERMKLYWSDTDLQVRLLRNERLFPNPIQVVHDLPIQHFGHQTTKTLPDRRTIWESDRQAFLQSVRKS